LHAIEVSASTTAGRCRSRAELRSTFSSVRWMTKLVTAWPTSSPADATLGSDGSAATWNARLAVKRDVHCSTASPAVLANTLSTQRRRRTEPACRCRPPSRPQGTVGVVNESNNKLLELDCRCRMAAGGRAGARHSRAVLLLRRTGSTEGVMLGAGLAYQHSGRVSASG